MMIHKCLSARGVTVVAAMGMSVACVLGAGAAAPSVETTPPSATAPTTRPAVESLTITDKGEVNLDMATMDAPPDPLPLPAGVTAQALTQPNRSPAVNRYASPHAQQLRRWRAEHGINLSIRHDVGYSVQTDLNHKEIGPHVPT